MQSFKKAFDILKTGHHLSLAVVNEWAGYAGIDIFLEGSQSLELTATQVSDLLHAQLDTDEVERILTTLAEYVINGVQELFTLYGRYGDRTGDACISKFQIQKMLLDGEIVTNDVECDQTGFNRAQLQVVYSELFGSNFRLSLSEFSYLLKAVAAKKNQPLILF